MTSPAALAHDGAASLLRLAVLRSRLDADVLDGIADGSVKPPATTTERVSGSRSEAIPDPVHHAAAARWDALETLRRIDTALRWCSSVLPALEEYAEDYLEGLQ